MPPRRQAGAPAPSLGSSGATAVGAGASGAGIDGTNNSNRFRPPRPLRPPPPPPPPSLALDGAALVAGLALVSIMFSVFAPEAYMDETFHVNQTRAYCEGRWRDWDPKITTPPGLYVSGVGWAAALRAAAALRRRLVPFLRSSSSAAAPGRPLPPLEAFCTTTNLRFLNVLLSLVCFVAAAAVHRGIHFVTWTKKRKTKKKSNGGSGTTTPAVVTVVVAVDENPQLAARGYPLTLAAAALVALLPTSAFYSFLFYTDVGALAAVLCSWALALRRRYGLSALASLASLAFRQTSAVWCCFVLGDAALRELALFQQQQENGEEEGEGEEGGGGGGDGAEGAKGNNNSNSNSSSSGGGGGNSSSAPPQTILREAAAVAAALLENRAAALRAVLLGSCLPLLSPLLAAAAFVLWNGGSLALGDKDNHSVSAHWAQALYVSCFAFLALFPALGSKGDVVAALVSISPVRAVEAEGGGGGEGGAKRARRRGRRAAEALLRPNVQGLRSFLSLLCPAWLAAAHGTIEHPFLLSDNRHYSFYAWRLAARVLGPVGSPGRILATALAGAAAFAWLRRRLVASFAVNNRFPRAWFLGFSLAAAASLVPSPLLEFRYFTPAVAVAALAGAAPAAAAGGRGGGRGRGGSGGPASPPPPPSPGQLAVALLLYVGVLAAVVRVFLMRPFEQDGELKRFMF